MMIGTTINNYKILNLIGKGGMGTVYLALDIMLDRKVALKMLHPDLLNQKEILDRFRSEAKTLASLNHPNIATLYNLLEDKGRYYMVLEYVDGEDLEKIIQREGALPASDAIRLSLQVLNGIAYAHGRKIIHRDIKPANLMLNKEGVIKIMDFGIARMLGSSRHTQIGKAVGTLEYMAPEQIRGQEGDERSDIYALGVVLYEMLTGNVPFRSKSDYDLMTKKLNNPAPKVQTFVHEIPKSIDKAITNSLIRDPGQRIKTAKEFHKLLKDCLSELNTAKAIKGKRSKKVSMNLAYMTRILSSAFVKFQMQLNMRTLIYFLFFIVFISGVYLLRDLRLQWVEHRSHVQEMIKSEPEKPNLGPVIGEVPSMNKDTVHTSGAKEIEENPVLSGIQKNKEENTEDHTPQTVSGKVPQASSSQFHAGNDKQYQGKSQEGNGSNQIAQGNNEIDVKNGEPENTLTKDGIPNTSGGNSNDPNDNKVEPGKNRASVSTTTLPETSEITKTLKLTSGTEVFIKLIQPISSEFEYLKGETIHLIVSKPVIIKGLIVISEGTKAVGHIRNIRAGTPRKGGLLELVIDELILDNGRKIKLKASTIKTTSGRSENVIYNQNNEFAVLTANSVDIELRIKSAK